ncbi:MULTISPECIES: alkaline phosphatase [unclassified Sphingomonas]|jgi:alkaline phosphatase D|uniref:alkaline phosphatase D family protein n=1 Tax=unclassified Sphingomonas TaxID=196159 RepID=UPI000E10DC5F|nr:MULTISPECIES: alkaline phosphatase D family protein [unclassified Sphingomonas]AXJ94194.1 alkaline phosphatase [Sphingomonas sp. FARSPH]
MTIDRRQTLALLGSGAGLCVPAAAARAEGTAACRFDHGVASGDPAADGAILWTRATPTEAGRAADIPLTWHVAIEEGGRPVVSGRVAARAARDFTAKVEARGLNPGRDHWFWFEGEGGVRSPVGRFRTLPVGKTADVVMAVVSCQLYAGGFYTAYDSIARQPRLDAVLHLGDYIYEYGVDGYGAEIAKKIGRFVEPRHEIVSLADYRMRHAQVKRDPQMQAAHARTAFICVWDDHEVANDDWVDGAENHQPAVEGDWAARKRAAMQAYFEWMPIRDPIPGKPWEAINRSFEFGDLATLAMVETRLLARSHQAVPKGADVEPSDYAALQAVRARPDREMLGANQQRWLEETLAASVKAGKPWQVLGNQVIMAKVNGPDLEKQLGAARYAELLAHLPDAYRSGIAKAVASYRAGLPLGLDSWDGYPPARERLYAAFRRAGSSPVVVSGDSHAGWANVLHDDAQRPVAVEFGATAITSPSYGALIPGIGEHIAAANPGEVLFCDQDNKGYLLLTLTREAATGDLRTVSTVTAPEYRDGSAAVFRCRADAKGALERA